MEEQVARAALAMVQPTTDPASRREASRFLEEWTRTPDALDVYTKWLASYRQQGKLGANGVVSSDDCQIPMQMLCLTMLQSRLRREMRQSSSTNPNGMAALRIELWEYLREQPHLNKSLIGPCCICNAITIVRSEGGTGLIEFLTNARNNTIGLPPETVMRLLGCIPSEIESRQDLTNGQVIEILQLHLEAALDLVAKGLSGGSDASILILPACQALLAWIEKAQVSLTQINAPTCGGSVVLLPILIKLLSSTDTNFDEVTLQTAARALTAAIGGSSDYGTTTRRTASAAFWMAIPQQGFIVHPLQVATANEWNDAAHALASLLATFLVENAREIVDQPADIGLRVLLEIQSHPSVSIALIPLECWLTIQEIPTPERHEHWRKPLFKNLVEILLRRMAYPENFTSWESELELVDSSDFSEFRRMVVDVLVSCYFLLRVEMIQILTNEVRVATDWRMSEAALYALAQIAKDACAQCRSPTADGTATQQELLQLLEQLIAVDSGAMASQHKYLLGAAVNFCGNYSPAWSSMKCPPHAILKLLTYLQSAFVAMPLEAAKATRAIYVSCLVKSMPNLEDLHSNSNGTATGNENNPTYSFMTLILKSVQHSMEAVLSTTDEEAMTNVAEGATRLITKLVNPEVARRSMTTDLIQPVTNRIDSALKALPQSNIAQEWMTVPVQSATESLARYLCVIRVISRFCDAPHIPAMGEWMLHLIDPCLNVVQQRIASTPAQSTLLSRWISIHQQILRKTLPQQSIMVTIFSNTIPLIVQALEQTRDPATLIYITTAVEVFGGQNTDMDKSFKDLLVHVTTVMTSNNNLFNEMELLQSYFECLHRCILYCPRALCYNPKLADIMNIAVGFVSAIDSKYSVRAALVFLSQLFGWNSLRLSVQTAEVLREAWNSLIIKEMILRHGQSLIQACFAGLTGGSQMLWPAYADCIYAVVQAIMLNEKEGLETPRNPADNISPLLNEASIKQWLFHSMTHDTSDVGAHMSTEISNHIIPTLLALARDGSSKSRPKARMLLTDYASNVLSTKYYDQI
eukprot:jgi/Psemu1/260089/estExt_Genewise1Plus.C_4120048